MRLVLGLAAVLLPALCQSAWAVPAVTLSSTGGQPGASVTVTGSGFAANASVDVFFDTTDVALAASSAAGATSTTITVPASAQPKAHWITLVTHTTGAAAQASYYVQTYWPQAGFGASGRRSNDFENTVSADNVSGLTRAWSANLNGYGNIVPFVEWGGYVYTTDYAGQVRVFRSNGTLLWTAPTALNATPLAPVVFSGRVYFPSENGTVYAFSTTCRTDGGVCTPAWTHSVGTAVTASLVSANGMIYVPSSDKTIHALVPSTGAEGTALPASTDLGSGYPAVSAAPAFGGDGSYAYGAGNYFGIGGPAAESISTMAATVGTASYVNGRSYFMTSDGALHQPGVAASPVIGGGGCIVTGPAVAHSVVYAGACGGLGAFDAGTMATVWSTTAVGFVTGLAEANGVLYVCDGQVSAWNASNGARLWSGGPCNGQPIVVDGTLYVTGIGRLDAYDLTTGRAARRHVGRPDPRRLRPDPRLHRAHRRT